MTTLLAYNSLISSTKNITTSCHVVKSLTPLLRDTLSLKMITWIQSAANLIGILEDHMVEIQPTRSPRRALVSHTYLPIAPLEWILLCNKVLTIRWLIGVTYYKRKGIKERWAPLTRKLLMKNKSFRTLWHEKNKNLKKSWRSWRIIKARVDKLAVEVGQVLRSCLLPKIQKKSGLLRQNR